MILDPKKRYFRIVSAGGATVVDEATANMIIRKLYQTKALQDKDHNRNLEWDEVTFTDESGSENTVMLVAIYQIQETSAEIVRKDTQINKELLDKKEWERDDDE
jgi:hypothetical protein